MGEKGYFRTGLRKARIGRRMAAGAFAALLAPINAAAEPSRADAGASYFAARAQTGASLGRFDLVGVDVALSARGRMASIDTAQDLQRLEEAQEMQKFMPGYPQPAHVTVSMQVSF